MARTSSSSVMRRDILPTRPPAQGFSGALGRLNDFAKGVNIPEGFCAKFNVLAR